MKMSVNFAYGLDDNSIDWLLRQSYFDVIISIGDQNSLSSSRRLYENK